VRNNLAERLKNEGIEKLLAELKIIDPKHYDFVDKKNGKRIVHALEVFYTTGKAYSSFLTRKTLRNSNNTEKTATRPFNILKIGLERPREELFQRINDRVDQMVNDGLLHEAMTLYPHRDKNALNTVGYKEMFNVIEGKWELQMAIERIKKNTRVYAKKQMTWFKHDTTINWFHPNEHNKILEFITGKLKGIDDNSLI
jgi:tRNA dimethylallyltransferase